MTKAHSRPACPAHSSQPSHPAWCVLSMNQALKGDTDHQAKVTRRTGGGADQEGTPDPGEDRGELSTEGPGE